MRNGRRVCVCLVLQHSFSSQSLDGTGISPSPPPHWCNGVWVCGNHLRRMSLGVSLLQCLNLAAKDDDSSDALRTFLPLQESGGSSNL